jgi:RNA polymerase sigma factor (sigma-70 family)
MTSARPVSVVAGDDVAWVRAAVAGDRGAFAAIYDRYADRLFDFCMGTLRDRDGAADCVQDTFVTAASRLSQLRDPERLGSWLYAIARNEALARIRARRREAPSEVLPERASTEPGPEMLAARTELADLISEACGGLSDRDRAVYELAYRQGLDGLELAEALGVSHTNANTLVGRLRDNVERSLGALLVCRAAKADPTGCSELAALTEHWDGRFTVLMRKRVARHIDGCAVCERDRRRRVNPAALLGSAPLVLRAPAWLRSHTLAQLPSVTPPPVVSSGAPGVHAGAGPGSGGVGSAPGPGGHPSWWPPHAFDTSDLGAPTRLPLSHPGGAPHNPGGAPPAAGRSLAGPPAAAGPGGPQSGVRQPFKPRNHATPTRPSSPLGPDRGSPHVPHSHPNPAAPPRSLNNDSGTGHLGSRVRTVLLAAVLLLALGAGLLWGRPLVDQVRPAATPDVSSTPTPSTTPALPTTAVASEPISSPAQPSTTTSEPSAPITTTPAAPGPVDRGGPVQPRVPGSGSTTIESAAPTTGTVTYVPRVTTTTSEPPITHPRPPTTTDPAPSGGPTPDASSSSGGSSSGSIPVHGGGTAGGATPGGSSSINRRAPLSICGENPAACAPAVAPQSGVGVNGLH